MPEAATVPISAASARNGYGDNQEILILFGLWCRGIQFEPGPELADRTEQAIRDKIDDRLRLERSIARMAMMSDVGKAALIWISTLRLCNKVDPENPVLPNPADKERRALVLDISARHPELARLAGVTWRYYPEDGSAPIVFAPMK